MAVNGVLMLGGGLAGYAKAHSKPSLIAGIASAILLGLACYVSIKQPRLGLGIGAAVGIGLIVVFVRRIQELSAQIPPGSTGPNIGLCALSGAVAIFLLVALSQIRS